MVTLEITDVPDEVVDRLKVRAVRHGRTPEAEAREILLSVVGPLQPTLTPAQVQERVRQRLGGKVPEGVVDDFLANRLKDWGEE
jgi:plasmid stability protein